MEKQQIMDSYWDGGQELPLTSAINDMYSEEEILEAMEPFKMNLPFHYEILIKELLQNQRNKPTI